MDRRGFVLTSLAGAFVSPIAVGSQPAGKVYRLGILSPAAAPSRDDRVAGHPHVIEVLREFGYVEGQNLVIERRYAHGRVARLPTLAAELVQRRVDTILAVGVAAVQAARDVTRTVPIVMGFASEPDKHGWVLSLGRPGGNVTGITIYPEGALAGRRLELLKEAVPRATRIAVLSTEDPGSQAQAREAEKAAASLGVNLIVLEVRQRDYERTFAAMKAERAAALFVVSSPILNTDRRLIIALAARYALPAIYEWREHVEDGGLMAYGSSVFGLYRRVAVYIDRIFKGANPAELPVEQPTIFELTLNAKTAKTLGLTIPPSLLLRADHVIE